MILRINRAATCVKWSPLGIIIFNKSMKFDILDKRMDLLNAKYVNSYTSALLSFMSSKLISCDEVSKNIVLMSMKRME